MKLFVFGSSILSSYWNGAATYYRGIYRALQSLGHEITFAEPDAFGRQQHLDDEDYSFVNSVVYSTTEPIERLVRQAYNADVVIKHSGVGVRDEELESAVLKCQDYGCTVIFWDVDAPATLARIARDETDPFRNLIPSYDMIFTYGGGPEVVLRYTDFGASSCHPIYNALDPSTHFPVAPVPELTCDLAFLGNRLPDRERRVDELFIRTAQLAPESSFLLGGEGWGDKKLPDNIKWIGHAPTSLHNAINSSARFVLNINRDSMASVGFSPPTRVFEAAGSAACMMCDEWPGIEYFFTPEEEILVVRSAEEVVGLLQTTSLSSARQIGSKFRRRALRDHTYAQRAQQAEAILRSVLSDPASAVGGRLSE